MTKPGLFLVFEGVEGAGKTTQARLLSEWLDELGVAHLLAREPGGTPSGEAIRRILLDSGELEIIAETELLLMLAARAAFVRQLVRPALASGQVMIADRFELSTMAYQGFGRGLGLERVRELNAFATGGLRPDLTLVFDVPSRVGRVRQAESGKVQDRIEGEGGQFLEAVAEAYRRLAEADDSVTVVDGTPDPEEVHETVRGLLRARFPEPFGTRRG